MKILAFTDPHGSRAALRKVGEKAPKADLIICPGDLTMFGEDADDLLSEMNSWGKPILLVPGNHEEHFDLKQLCTGFKNIFEIDREFYTKGDLLVAGYGRGGFSHETPEFEVFGRQIKRKVKEHQGPWILLLHQPPFGTNVDRLSFGHVGNETFSAFIAEAQPTLVLCGHLHENFKKEDMLGKSRILNPGPDGVFLDL